MQNLWHQLINENGNQHNFGTEIDKKLLKHKHLKKKIWGFFLLGYTRIKPKLVFRL